MYSQISRVSSLLDRSVVEMSALVREIIWRYPLTRRFLVCTSLPNDHSRTRPPRQRGGL